jgi:membrane protein DedA with SNARE-associated domain/rhodanese-related sulfurtransferase
VDNPIGLGVIFVNVLCDQLGLPLPAVPTLVVAGAMAADGQLPAAAVFGLAVCACLIGDSAWYVAGRLFGGRVMKLLCRISLTPDTCVNDTQSSFERWGAKVLIVAKFLPGLSLVAPPLAGATRMSAVRFVTYSTLSAMLWVGAALTGGLLLKPQIEQLLPHVAALGGAAIAVILLLLLSYIAYKWWQRWRFYRVLNMARISVDELYRHMKSGHAPVVLDVRSATAQGIELRRIPGALHVPVAQVGEHIGKLPRDRDIILYCTCPNEASAAQAARLLMSRGFRRVRPLRGGLEAWIAAGYAVEEVPATTPAAVTPQAA